MDIPGIGAALSGSRCCPGMTTDCGHTGREDYVEFETNRRWGFASWENLKSSECFSSPRRADTWISSRGYDNGSRQHQRVWSG